MWDIHQRIIHAVPRIHDGYYHIIPPSEFEAWFRLTGTLVYTWEYDILVGMDAVYCDEANKELEDLRERRTEEFNKQMEQKNRK